MSGPQAPACSEHSLLCLIASKGQACLSLAHLLPQKETAFGNTTKQSLSLTKTWGRGKNDL